MFVNVSLMGIPLELPDEYVTEVHTVYKNGVRVYQFRKLERDIPQYMQIMGNRIKSIYTGQKKVEKVKSNVADPIDLGETI